MSLPVSLVVAACSNRGIGIGGKIPWKLSADVLHFKRVTSSTRDPDRCNAVIMGRKTWDSIPQKFKPLKGRLNIVISSSLPKLPLLSVDDFHVERSFADAMKFMSCDSVRCKVEQAFVIGGESIYRAALDSGLCKRIYLTEIYKDFECDAFFPEFDHNIFLSTCEDGVNSDLQTDDRSQLQYRFLLYQRKDVADDRIHSDSNLCSLPLQLSVAMDINRGFGYKGSLPWSLPKEFESFLMRLSHTSVPDKKVAVIKGRKTWESTSDRERSIGNVVNIIISSTLREPPEYVWRVVKSFRDALEAAKCLVDNGTVEKVWVLGGVPVYQAALDSGLCQRLYVSRIQATYSCDVFFPSFEENFSKVSCESVQDGDVTYFAEVYEPCRLNSGLTVA